MVEAFLIVASILLAFAIDAWWDGRSEGREDRALLEGFREDLRADSAVYVGVLEDYPRTAAAYERLLLFVEGTAEPADTVGLTTALRHSVVVPMLHAKQRTTYEAAVQMGGFGRMRDRELSRALIGYYAIPFAATNDVFNEAWLAGVYFPYDRALRRALGREYRALMTCVATDGACIRAVSAGLRLERVAADPEMAEHLVGLSAYAPFWLSVIRTQNEARARVLGRVEAALGVD